MHLQKINCRRKRSRWSPCIQRLCKAFYFVWSYHTGFAEWEQMLQVTVLAWWIAWELCSLWLHLLAWVRSSSAKQDAYVFRWFRRVTLLSSRNVNMLDLLRSCWSSTNFCGCLCFQGLHSIAVFKNTLTMPRNDFLRLRSCIHRERKIQTENVFCWRNDDFIYNIWSQRGCELITLLRWANQYHCPVFNNIFKLSSNYRLAMD